MFALPAHTHRQTYTTLCLQSICVWLSALSLLFLSTAPFRHMQSWQFLLLFRLCIHLYLRFINLASITHDRNQYDRFASSHSPNLFHFLPSFHGTIACICTNAHMYLLYILWWCVQHTCSTHILLMQYLSEHLSFSVVGRLSFLSPPFLVAFVPFIWLRCERQRQPAPNTANKHLMVL